MKLLVSINTTGTMQLIASELRRSRRGEAQDCGLVVCDAVWFRVCRRFGGIPAFIIRDEGNLVLKAFAIRPGKCRILHIAQRPI
jgi:hypothetical protein